MNTYEEAKRILSELSLENIALRSQIQTLVTQLEKGEIEKRSRESNEGEGAELQSQSQLQEKKVPWGVRTRHELAKTVKAFPSLVHFVSIVALCYVWGRWSLPFWLIFLFAIPYLEIVKGEDAKRLANTIVVERYLRRLLIVDDDQYSVGDTAAWLNRAFVRLWPSALEPMISASVMESVQAIFDTFLESQSVVKRLRVEGVSLGKVPLRIKRVRTALPEANVAVTKRKQGRKQSMMLNMLEKLEDRRVMEFDRLLDHFQKDSAESRVDIDLDFQFVPSDDMKFEISAGLLEALPIYMHLNSLTLEGTIRIRLSKLMSEPPFIGVLGITFPSVPDLDFEIRPVSKLLGDVTSMPILNQVGELVRSSLTVLALPNVLELPLGEWSKPNPSEEDGAVKIVNIEEEKGENWDEGIKDKPSVRLDIEVLRAHNLAAADMRIIGSNSSDPYVEISCAHNWARTKVKKRTLSPKWNEHFTFMLQDVEKPVKFAVYDHDIVGKNTLLGSAVLDLESLFDGTSHMVDLKLESVEYGQRGTLKVVVELYDLNDLDEDAGVDEELVAAPEGRKLNEEPSSLKLGGNQNSPVNSIQGDSPRKVALTKTGDLPRKVTLTPTKTEKGDVNPAVREEESYEEPSASLSPSPSMKKELRRVNTKTLQGQASGSYTGYITMRGGWLGNTMKERYCVLAKRQMIFYKDISCLKEMYKMRISSSMEVIGLGCTANGYPVQILESDGGKLLLEVFLKSDSERQKLVKTFELFVKE